MKILFLYIFNIDFFLEYFQYLLKIFQLKENQNHHNNKELKKDKINKFHYNKKFKQIAESPKMISSQIVIFFKIIKMHQLIMKKRRRKK